MCSEAIILANSCYIDNLSKVFDLITLAFVCGGFIALTVGIIIYLSKKK